MNFLLLLLQQFSLPAKIVTTGRHCWYLYVNRRLTLFHLLSLWSRMPSKCRPQTSASKIFQQINQQYIYPWKWTMWINSLYWCEMAGENIRKLLYMKLMKSRAIGWISPLWTIAYLAVGQNWKCESVGKQSTKARLFLSFKIVWKTSSAFEVSRLSNTPCLPTTVNHSEIQNIVLVPEFIKMALVFVRGSDCNHT